MSQDEENVVSEVMIPSNEAVGHSNSVIKQGDVDVLDEMYLCIRNQINELKNQVASQHADIAQQDYQIDSMEQDIVQKEEREEKMQNRIKMLEDQVLMLQAEMDCMESNKRAVDELQSANLRLRELKQKAEKAMNDIKTNNEQLLDVVWHFYSGYNEMLNRIIASCEKNPNDSVSKTIKENTQVENQQIVQKVVNDVNSWDKSATDYAVGMALAFNQEKRRIALKQRFSKTNTPRSRWF